MEISRGAAILSTAEHYYINTGASLYSTALWHTFLILERDSSKWISVVHESPCSDDFNVAELVLEKEWVSKLSSAANGAFHNGTTISSTACACARNPVKATISLSVNVIQTPLRKNGRCTSHCRQTKQISVVFSSLR